jgi:chorismate dehydratase
MTRVRLGSVSYLNARPCVVGLEDDPHFDLRFDLPSRCAALLHDHAIDAGLIPSIEYLRHPGRERYCIVPDVAIASFGPVASVALYTARAIGDVRSIAMDTSSRTSVALTRVLCARAFRIDPDIQASSPDLPLMLDTCDAALIIGDGALLLNHAEVEVGQKIRRGTVQKIDLGETWSRLTGLPFVYAFWAGHAGALDSLAVDRLQKARDKGVADPRRVAESYFADQALWDLGARYLRDNIQYHLGERERAGLEAFYRYAAELGLVPDVGELRFYR